MTELRHMVNEVGIADVVDVLIMSVIMYSTIVWFKRTKAIFVIIGMFTLGVGYLLAHELDLTLTYTVFQGFFAVFLIAVVVIFQEEIRQFFEFLARWTTTRKVRNRRAMEIPRQEVDILVNVLSDLASERVGALIVLRGKDPIVRHLDGGIDLNGELSEDILKSLFDPHSVGHDGAAVISGNIITEFSAHLPLSKNLRMVGRGGTRHAAALGLSEVCDALCLIVSEERGTISAARHGELRILGDRQALSGILDEFSREIVPVQNRKPWREFFRKNYREKGIAIGITLILWFVFVHGARIDYRTFRIPAHVSGLQTGMEVSSISPKQVDVTLSAPRRAFYFLNADEISLVFDLYTLSEGTYRKIVSESNVSCPPPCRFESSDPPEVTVTIDRSNN